MSELERLHKDLEAVEHLIKVFEDHFGQKSIKLNEIQSNIQAKIKELEAMNHDQPARDAVRLLAFLMIGLILIEILTMGLAYV